MSNSFHRQNLERLVALQEVKDLRAVILEDPVNLFYYTGFETSVPKGIYAVIPRAGEPFIVMQKLEAVLFHVTGAFDKIVLRGHKDPVGDLLAALLGSNISGRIGLDLGRVSASFYRRLEASRGLQLVDVSEDLARHRYTKNDLELSRIRHACLIAMKAMTAAVSAVEDGKTELQVAGEAVRVMMGEGAEPAFTPTVQTGSRGSLPNSLSSTAVIHRGELVTIDLGVRYLGYCSDICRTTVCGRANQEQKGLLSIVKKAQLAAIQSVRPGVAAASIDAAARKVIEESGHGPKLIHRVGHGVGCEIHEKPFLGPDHLDILEAGVVMSVEPGVYDSSFGGVRIEDNVLVTEAGFEVLTQGLPWEVQ